MKWLLEQGEARLDGFVLPGHVCTVMGYEEYEQFPVPAGRWPVSRLRISCWVS